MSNKDLHICETQGEIYEYMRDKGYDLKTFSDAYLASDFCNREMDSFYSPFHSDFPDSCASVFLPEIKDKLIKAEGKEYNDSVADDIGFMYRYLYMETSIPSRELPNIIPYDEMARYAWGCDHYGYEEMLKDIMKDYNLSAMRYDKDVVRMTHEEMEEMDIKAKEEHRALEKKYLGR